MKITGITAEYNPLHNGHIYQLEQARMLSGCDAVAVAMSGDFVQRGEPALLDKWTRCALALDAGADLVVEIPVLFCLGNASQYAAASVRILESLGCGSIAFGSESGDTELLSGIAGFLDDHGAELDGHAALLAKEGSSYPAVRAEAYRKLRSENGADDERLAREIRALGDPNDILAIEYIRCMRSASPLCVKRQGPAHGDSFDGGRELQSASAIREILRTGQDPELLKDYIPECTYRALVSEKPVFADEEWMKLIRYAAMMTPPDRIEDCPSAGEGLGNLISRHAAESSGMDDLIKAVKSKRYTYSRISRLCMQLVLGISRAVYGRDEPQYIRVLGFSSRGREILADLRKREDGLPVITNINKECGRLSDNASSMLALDVKAADIYNMVTGRGSAYSDHIRKPVKR